MNADEKRRLIIIPIAHTAADLGTLAPRPRTVAQRIEFERKQNIIKAAWQEIEQNLFGWRTDFSGVSVYQDGLPIDDGREIELIEKVAAGGSLNFALLLKLRKRDAKIVGTESPELLQAELELQKKIANAADAKKPVVETNRILRARDEFIAQRIDETLPVGASGILFIGLLHRVEDYLPENIEVLKGKLK